MKAAIFSNELYCFFEKLFLHSFCAHPEIQRAALFLRSSLNAVSAAHVALMELRAALRAPLIWAPLFKGLPNPNGHPHQTDWHIIQILLQVIWSESGTEKYTLNMENVKLIKMTLMSKSDSGIPALLPAKASSSEVIVIPSEASGSPKSDAEIEHPAMNETRLVELKNGSPDSDEDLDEDSLIRIDFVVFRNEGLIVKEDDDSDHK